jgi:hypothetical protein
MAIPTPKTCAGVFGPCSKTAIHCLEDPEGKGEPVLLCEEHWLWAERLITKLEADPELTRRFEKAINEATN